MLAYAVVMVDWQRLVGQWAGGRHSLPKFASGPAGTKRFVTTVQYVRAHRGQFTFEDHGTPWSTVVRNLDINVTKVLGYRGEVTSHGSVVTIQNYLPMSMDLRALFKVADGGVRHFDTITPNTDGAEPPTPAHPAPARRPRRRGRPTG